MKFITDVGMPFYDYYHCGKWGCDNEGHPCQPWLVKELCEKLSQVFKNRWVWVCTTNRHGHDLSVWKMHHLRDRSGKILVHIRIHGPKPGPEHIIAGCPFKDAVMKSKKGLLGELQKSLEVVTDKSDFYGCRSFSTSRNWPKNEEDKRESRCLAMFPANSAMEEWDSSWPDERKADTLKRLMEKYGGIFFKKGLDLVRPTEGKANHHRGGSAPP